MRPWAEFQNLLKQSCQQSGAVVSVARQGKEGTGSRGIVVVVTPVLCAGGGSCNEHLHVAHMPARFGLVMN